MNLRDCNKEQAKKLLDDMFYHVSRDKWKEICLKIIEVNDVATLQRLCPQKSLVKYAPCFTPYFNDQTKAYATQEFPTKESKFAFNEALEFKMFDVNWLLPEIDRRYPYFVVTAMDSLPRSQMATNVSESAECISYKEAINVVCQAYKDKQKEVQQLGESVVKEAPKPKAKAKSPSQLKPKSLQLQISNKRPEPSEEVHNKRLDQKRKREARDEAGLQQMKPRQKKDPDVVQIRSLTLRLYPRPGLKKKLQEWQKLFMDALLFCNREQNHELERGKYHSMEVLRDKLKLNCSKFPELPLSVLDQAAVESFAQYKSAQANLKTGHIKQFRLSECREDLLGKATYLKFHQTTATVRKDVVRLYPTLLKDDSELLVKDALTNHNKTSAWHQWFPIGRKLKGKQFTISWNNAKRKYFIHLPYDALDPKGPFTESKYADLQAQIINGNITDLRAVEFILRQQKISQPTSNTCSIDRGIRVISTVFDVRRKQFVSILPDCQEHIVKINKIIGRAQSARDMRLNEEQKLKSEFQWKFQALEQQSIRDKRSRRRERKKLTTTRLRRSTRPKFVREQDANRKKAGYVAPNLKSIRYQHECLSATISDVTDRMCNLLVMNYDLVITAEFPTKQMIAKRRKKLKLPKPDFLSDKEYTEIEKKQFTLPKKSRTVLAKFGHYRFTQKLVQKFQTDLNKSKRVLITTEEFTSKQHPFRQVLNLKLGSSKVWRMEDFVGWRDNVGAFNHFTRSLTKEEVSMKLRGPGNRAEDNRDS